MCENIGEKEATVTQELIPSAIKVAARRKFTTATCSSNTGGGNTGHSSAALSLFDQLKNSVSHNLTVSLAEKTINNNNNTKRKTIISQSVEKICNDANQTEVNKSNEHILKLQHSNKWQSFHKTPVKSLTTTAVDLQQEEQGNNNDKDLQEADECLRNEYDEDEEEYADVDDDDNDDDHDVDEEDDYDDDSEVEEANKEQYVENTTEEYIGIERKIRVSDKKSNNKTCLKPKALSRKPKLTSATPADGFSNMVEECNDLTSSSTASSISATTAPLQIALDSTSSHSSSNSSNNNTTNNNSNSNGAFNEQSKVLASQNEGADNNIGKLSTADLKTKFDFLTESSAEELRTTTISSQLTTATTTTTAAAAALAFSLKAAGTETTSSKSSITNFFATDGNICDNSKRIDAIATKTEHFSIPSLLLPVASPLLGIVHGTKRASMLSSSPSSSTSTSTSSTTITTNSDSSSLSPATVQHAYEVQTPSHLDAGNRSRKLVKNLANETAFRSHVQQQQQQQQLLLHPPQQQQEQLQLMPNAAAHPHCQRQLHKATSGNTKKIQKSVLSFSRNAANENKRKRCNDRYDSSESSDR